MADRTYQEAVDGILATATIATAAWVKKMEPYADEAVEHLRKRVEMMAVLIYGAPESVKLLAETRGDRRQTIDRILQIARSAFIMGYCSLIVEADEAGDTDEDGPLYSLLRDMKFGDDPHA